MSLMTLVTLQNPKYICVQTDSCLPSAGIHKRLFALFFSHMENGLEKLQLSEAGLKALGQCGTLGAVNAGQAHGVTDAVVSALCEGNLSLKSLV
jgi:hypothetical protein